MGRLWWTGQRPLSPGRFCLLAEQRVAVPDGAGQPEGQAAGLWEEISEAPTQGIDCAAVRRTVEPVERARTIHRTAAKTEKRFYSPSEARSVQ